MKPPPGFQFWRAFRPGAMDAGVTSGGLRKDRVCFEIAVSGFASAILAGKTQGPVRAVMIWRALVVDGEASSGVAAIWATLRCR